MAQDLSARCGNIIMQRPTKRRLSQLIFAVTMIAAILAVSAVQAVASTSVLQVPSVLTIDNSVLSLTFHTDLATLTVVDLRTNDVWTQQPLTPAIIVKSATIQQPSTISTTLLFSRLNLQVAVTIALQGDEPEFLVQLAGNGAMSDLVKFPNPFVTETGTYLVVPLNEGISYPVEDTSISPTWLSAYAGHGGMSMAFWGVTDGDKGQMAIIETPNDAAIRIDRNPSGNLYVAPEWVPQKGQFGYARSLRYVFFDHGGYVAMCKQYRSYAQAIGLLKTLQQKLQENPNVDLLIGAVNVWSAPPLEDSHYDKLAIAKEMKSLGIERILFNTLGFSSEAVPPSVIQTMNDMGILTGRYDDYHDVMDPAKFGLMKNPIPPWWWVEGAWPSDIIIGPDGQWVKGWSVTGKDGNPIPLGIVSDKQALKYAVRILEELKTRPYRARFIDIATADRWFEDYSSDHSLTRSESRQGRMDLLQYVSGQTGMVTGSETGIDAAVPYVHYFEGMLSLVPYRPPEGSLSQILNTVPDQVAKFQVGHTYRLPLWELVYHDCVVSYWWWNDYNNKIPAIWDKKDLFNILYGTPPMFMFNKDTWNANKQRFVQSYKNVSPVARQVGLSEMTDHHLLTADRSVQQTLFENGVTITVNFGQAPYYLPDGTTVQPMGFRVSSRPAETLTVTLAAKLNAAIVTHDVPQEMVAGRDYTAHVTIRNMGTMTWTATSYMLAFADQSSFGPATVALDPGASVAPGQEYTFTFTMTAPTNTGSYTVSYQMLRMADSVRFGQMLELPVTVTQG